MLYRIVCLVLTILSLVFTDSLYYSVAGTGLSFITFFVLFLGYYPFFYGLINFIFIRQYPLWKLLIPIGLVLSVLMNLVLFTNLNHLKSDTETYSNELGTTTDIPSSVYDDIDHINRELSGLIGPQINSDISLHEKTLLIQLSGLYRQYGEYIPELNDLYTKYEDYINRLTP